MRNLLDGLRRVFRPLGDGIARCDVCNDALTRFEFYAGRCFNCQTPITQRRRRPAPRFLRRKP